MTQACDEKVDGSVRVKVNTTVVTLSQALNPKGQQVRLWFYWAASRCECCFSRGFSCLYQGTDIISINPAVYTDHMSVCPRVVFLSLTPVFLCFALVITVLCILFSEQFQNAGDLHFTTEPECLLRRHRLTPSYPRHHRPTHCSVHPASW